MEITLPCIEVDLKKYRRDERVRKRLFALRKLAKGETQKSVVLELGLVERTLIRWKRRYEAGGAAALIDKARPGRPRKKWLRGKQAKKILALRRKYGWGAEVLKAHAEKMYGIRTSLYAVRGLLKRKQLVKRVRRKKKSKHTKKVKIFHPGAHTQMDVRYLSDLREEKTCYVYNFVDHASKWTFKKVFRSYGSLETKEFMEELLRRCPFRIDRLQTDNGVEFTYRFRSNREHVLERICKQEGIRLRFIPPGEKELQGLVEGHHRLDKDEFFSKIGRHTMEETNRLLEEHLVFRNGTRGFKTNGWMSPEEYLKAYLIRYLVTASLLAKKIPEWTDKKSEQIPAAA